MLVEEPKGCKSTIVLQLPGRVRFKILRLYKNPGLANKLTEFVYEEGVYRVEANVYSTSFLVLYDPILVTAESLAAKLDAFLIAYQIGTEETLAGMNCTASACDSTLPLNQTEFLARQDAVKRRRSEKTAKPTSLAPPPFGVSDEWYQLHIHQVMEIFNTDLKAGLSTGQAETLLRQIGLNEFAAKKQKSILSMFLSQFDSFLIKLLLGASVVSIFLGQVGDALTIVTIVGVEALLGLWQNYKAEKSLESLHRYSAAHSRVLRDGKIQQIPCRHLVPGDIICLEAGDLVPADARLIASANLETNETSLTGESVPVEKSHKVEYTAPIPLAERKNMVFMGTTITRGTAKALVVATGMHSQIGQIARMIDESEPAPTPLQNDLDRLAKVISLGCLGICGSIMFSGTLGGQPFFEMLRTGVSLAIGAIPEGLTSILTISLACGVQRMAKKGAIVKALPATEVLSCADVICTDKTGTLTKGQMTVTDIYTPDKVYLVTGDGYSRIGDILHNDKKAGLKDNPGLEKLVSIGALCNNTSYTLKKRNTLDIVGDPTEGALWVLAAKLNLQAEDFRCYTREKEVAFDSTTRKMIVVCKSPEGKYQINLKGDPNIILAKCTKILSGGTIRDLTTTDVQSANTAIAEMTDKALRVLGFAYKETDHNPDDASLEDDLIFTGLIGMMDPPREGVKEAISRCRKAGIRTIMITGDHKKTAEAIARQINLLGGKSEIITGEELEGLTDADLAERIEDVTIFARTSPHQKLRIVKALKDKGHIVVMTGDGVNDAPAIKAANIGIAMGLTGTDVTRESSSIVLTDDNFTTIVNAIEEGRGISGNIKKFMRFVLSGNIGEVFTIFFASLLGMPTPLIPGQILMVNLITEGIPALSLGVDTPEKDCMNQPPRNAMASIMDSGLFSKTLSRGIMMGVSTFSLFTGTYALTSDVTRARTLAYANLVANQMFHVFDCRKAGAAKNCYLLPSVAISSLLLLASIYFNPLQGLFGTCAIRGIDWLGILFMSSFIGRLDYIKELANQLVKTRVNPSITTKAVAV